MSEGEGSAPAEAGTTEASAAESAIPSRPDFVPEKFWNAESGEVRLEDAFKSYSEIEKKGRQRGDKMREEIMAEIAAETTVNRPETMDDYELVVPEFLQEQLGEDDT